MIRRLFRFLLPAFSLSLAMFVLTGCETVPRNMAPNGFSTVVIDAGHGGKDSGEHPRGGLYEKEVALDTAERVRDLLEDEGLHTVMTRTTDTFVELDDRVAIANHYGPNAILVSIHYNASPSSAPRGVETFFWRSDSYGLATRIQRHLLGETNLPNHGVTRRVLRLTHNPRVPCVLCECGYLTNYGDESLIGQASFRQKIAQGIVDGIAEQHEEGDANIGSLPRRQVTTYSAAPAHRRHRRHAGGGRRHRSTYRTIRHHHRSSSSN